jgi:hypothetical protein
MRFLTQADVGTRTRDPLLTMEVLYQLSYVGANPNPSAVADLDMIPDSETKLELARGLELLEQRDQKTSAAPIQRAESIEQLDEVVLLVGAE